MTEFTRVRKGYRPEEVEQELFRLRQKITEQEEELSIYRGREEELHRREIEAPDEGGFDYRRSAA